MHHLLLLKCLGIQLLAYELLLLLDGLLVNHLAMVSFKNSLVYLVLVYHEHGELLLLINECFMSLLL